MTHCDEQMAHIKLTLTNKTNSNLFINSMNKRFFFYINDLISIIANDINFKKFNKNLIIKSSDIFIKNAKNCFKRIKCNRLMKIKMIINNIN